MIIVGITGSVASGKNFIAKIFEKFHFAIFDADLEISNILSEEDTDLVHDILNGKRENDFDAKLEVAKCLKKLEKKGFKN